jgi:hypothetical protein
MNYGKAESKDKKDVKKNDVSVEIGHDDRGAHNVAGGKKKDAEEDEEMEEKEEKALTPEQLREFAAKRKKMAKAEDEEMEEKAMDEEKEEKSKKMDKSLISEDDLLKSLSRLEEVAKGGVGARKQELLKKSLSAALSDAENAELIKLLAGAREGGLREQVAKSMSGADNEELAKSIDVSNYIAELHKTLCDNMTSLATSIEKSESKSAERESVLAKGLLDLTKAMISQGRLVKSLQEKVDAFGRTPAHGPRAVQSREQLAKSGVASQAEGPSLSANQVLDTLEMMFQKSLSGGGDGVAISGESYEEAISKFEQTQRIHPQLLQAVVQFRQGR